MTEHAGHHQTGEPLIDCENSNISFGPPLAENQSASDFVSPYREILTNETIRMLQDPRRKVVNRRLHCPASSAWWVRETYYPAIRRLKESAKDFPEEDSEWLKQCLKAFRDDPVYRKRDVSKEWNNFLDTYVAKLWQTRGDSFDYDFRTRLYTHIAFDKDPSQSTEKYGISTKGAEEAEHVQLKHLSCDATKCGKLSRTFGWCTGNQRKPKNGVCGYIHLRSKSTNRHYYVEVHSSFEGDDGEDYTVGVFTSESEVCDAAREIVFDDERNLWSTTKPSPDTFHTPPATQTFPSMDELAQHLPGTGHGW